MFLYFNIRTPAEPLTFSANLISLIFGKINREQGMNKGNVVRNFNWIDRELLEEDPNVFSMAIYLTDTKEADDLRRILGYASQPRPETWELLIDSYLS